MNYKNNNKKQNNKKNKFNNNKLQSKTNLNFKFYQLFHQPKISNKKFSSKVIQLIKNKIVNSLVFKEKVY